MDLRHLRYFKAVATSLSFSRAAERLRIAQPALSRQIKDLEEEIGVTLLRRSTSCVQLTEAGQYLLEQTNRLLELLNNAVAKVQQIGKGATAEFNIGSDWNIPAPIAASVRNFRKLYPKLQVNLIELPSHKHIHAVRSGQIDVGFVSSAAIGSRHNLDFVRILSTPISVVLPAHHPLANRDRIRMAELKDERWIMPDRTEFAWCHDFVRQLLRSAKCTPKFGRTATSLQGVLGLVAADEGISLVAKALLVKRIKGIRVVPTDCPDYRYFAVSLKNPSSIFVTNYLEILKEESTEEVVPRRIA